MEGPGYEEVNHTADWALHVTGKVLDDLLENAAWGMLRLTGARARPGPSKKRTIELATQDAETLLVAWLEELLFGIESHGVTPTEIEVQTRDRFHLKGRLREAPIESLSRHIKAVTYHNLRVETTEEGMSATIVFDV